MTALFMSLLASFADYGISEFHSACLWVSVRSWLYV